MQRQNTNEWKKEKENKSSDVMGINSYVVKYHFGARETFSLHFCYDTVEIILKDEDAEDNRYSNLLSTISSKLQTENPMCWSGYTLSFRIAKLTVRCKDFETLKTALNIIAIAEFEKIPQEMTKDILLVCELSHNRQKKHIEELTNRIIAQDTQIIHDIQKYMENATLTQSSYVMELIKQLSAENKFYDAIVWSQIIPKANFFFKAIMQIGIDALLQLQFQISNSNETDKEVTFPSNQPRRGLSYLTVLFKFAWQVAEMTKEASDVARAFRYLGVLSGKSGFEKTFAETTASKTADVLIEYAYDFKQANEKIKCLSEEIKQLKSQHTKISHFGIFNSSASTANTDHPIRERKKLQRRLTQ